MNNKELISVIMPTYNTPQEFLKEAVESILHQSYTNFEFIIVDDCSTDNTMEYLMSFNDPRIRIIKNEVNMGITKSLNVGLGVAKGRYIARMDSDDISLPDRFEKQYVYMEDNSDVIVCGSWAEVFGKKNFIYQPILKDNEYFRCGLLFGNINSLYHPTAFFRKSMLDENGIIYDKKLSTAQDYEMWVQCSKAGRCTIVEEVLLKYRTHSRQISEAKVQIQTKCAEIVREKLLRSMIPDISVKQLERHWNASDRCNISIDNIRWLKYLHRININIKYFDCKTFEKRIDNLIFEKAEKSCRLTKNPFRILIIWCIVPPNIKHKIMTYQYQRFKRLWN